MSKLHALQTMRVTRHITLLALPRSTDYHMSTTLCSSHLVRSQPLLLHIPLTYMQYNVEKNRDSYLMVHGTRKAGIYM